MIDPLVETFLVVADAGSFSRASEKLFLSKVSVMKRIDTLERKIGVKLFQRTTQGVKLTVAGKVLNNGARHVMEQINNLLDEVSQTAMMPQNIKLGTSPFFPSQSLFQFLRNRNIDTDKFSFDVVPFGTGLSGINDALSSLGDDLDIVPSVPMMPEKVAKCHVLPLMDEPINIAMSRTHHLAKKKKLEWADLDGETMIIMRRGLMRSRDRIRDEIENNHPKIKIYDIEEPFSMKNFNLCNEKKYLMSIVPYWENLHPSLVSRPMAWDFTESCGIAYGKHPSDATLDFVEFLKENVKK